MMTRSRWIVLLILLTAGGFLGQVQNPMAQDAPPVEVPPSEEAPAEEVPVSEEGPTAFEGLKGKVIGPPIKENSKMRGRRSRDAMTPFKRSKYTYDITEGEGDRRTVYVGVGESRNVDVIYNDAPFTAEDVKNWNEDLFSLYIRQTPQGVLLQILGKKKGVGPGTITIYDKNGKLVLTLITYVTNQSLTRTIDELQELLRDIDGIEYRVIGDTLYLDGEVITPDEYGRIIQVLKANRERWNGVISLITLSPIALNLIAQRIQRDIVAEFPNVTLRVVNRRLLVEGTAKDPKSAEAFVRRIAGLYVPETLPPFAANFLTPDNFGEGSIPGTGTGYSAGPGKALLEFALKAEPQEKQKNRDLIRITIHVVELKKSISRVFGMNWTPSFTASPSIQVGNGNAQITNNTGNTENVPNANPLGSFSAIISNLLPRLQAAQDAGYARVMKTMSLITLEGNTAEGGGAPLTKATQEMQLPYLNTVVGQNGTVQTNVAFQPVTFDFTVTTAEIQDNKQDILINFDTAIMNIVGSGGQGGAQTTTSKMNSRLYIKAGESAPVYTFNGSDFVNDVNRPNAANENSFFNLQRSKKMVKEKSQVVVFVTPTLLDNSSDGSEELRRNLRVRTK